VFKAVPSPSLLFCAGHDWLPDGRLFVAGGHITDLHGLPNANIFDPATETWQAVAPMAQGRWYPTTTTLPDGDILTLAGTDQNDNNVLLPEIWNGSSWRQLTTASWGLPIIRAPSSPPMAVCSSPVRINSRSGSTSAAREHGRPDRAPFRQPQPRFGGDV
jgi:hypothetical protein